MKKMKVAHTITVETVEYVNIISIEEYRKMFGDDCDVEVKFVANEIPELMGDLYMVEDTGFDHANMISALYEMYEDSQIPLTDFDPEIELGETLVIDVKYKLM